MHRLLTLARNIEGPHRALPYVGTETEVVAFAKTEDAGVLAVTISEVREGRQEGEALRPLLRRGLGERTDQRPLPHPRPR